MLVLSSTFLKFAIWTLLCKKLYQLFEYHLVAQISWNFDSNISECKIEQLKNLKTSLDVLWKLICQPQYPLIYTSHPNINYRFWNKMILHWKRKISNKNTHLGFYRPVFFFLTKNCWNSHPHTINSSHSIFNKTKILFSFLNNFIVYFPRFKIIANECDHSLQEFGRILLIKLR